MDGFYSGCWIQIHRPLLPLTLGRGAESFCILWLLDVNPTVSPCHLGRFPLERPGSLGDVGLESNVPHSFCLGSLPLSCRGRWMWIQQSWLVPLGEKAWLPFTLYLVVGFGSNGLFLGACRPLDLDSVVVVLPDTSYWKLGASLASS